MIKKIVCFGDSNTHGYNSKTMGRFTEDERWTKLLGKYLGEKYDVATTEYEMKFTYDASLGDEFGPKMFSSIIKEYDGSNIRELAKKYGYSEKTVRRMIKDSLEEYD